LVRGTGEALALDFVDDVGLRPLLGQVQNASDAAAREDPDFLAGEHG
jgi:hypothetical protein